MMLCEIIISALISLILMRLLIRAIIINNEKKKNGNIYYGHYLIISSCEMTVRADSILCHFDSFKDISVNIRSIVSLERTGLIYDKVRIVYKSNDSEKIKKLSFSIDAPEHFIRNVKTRLR